LLLVLSFKKENPWTAKRHRSQENKGGKKALMPSEVEVEATE